MKQLGGIFTVLGIIFLALTFREGVAVLKPHVDLYAETTDVSDIGYLDMVEVEVDMSYGCAVQETTKKDDGSKSYMYYYVIPAYEGDEGRFICVKVSSKKHKTFEDITKITYQYFTDDIDEIGSKTIKITGCLKKMDSEVKNWYFEWFEDMGYTRDEINEYVLPLYIDAIAPENIKGMFLGGAGLFLLGVVFLVIGFIKSGKDTKKAKEQTHVVINGVSYPKEAFYHVNQCIYGQEKIFAAQEIHEITGVSMDEAGKIIDNWHKYFY